MTDSLHAFTSITANYLPKARVLAKSFKKHHPEGLFHLVLSDVPPDGFDLEQEPFDTLISVDDLPIDNQKGWLYKHTVVELCTAVKGLAGIEIGRRHGGGKVFYLDPDIAVFSRLDVLTELLDQHSFILTPHLLAPESQREAIMDNEICALRHGVYNLGFLGVNCDGGAPPFLEWWAERLQQFCYADYASGLFTDQRWVDLAPAFFSDFGIVRHPGCNVATWNISQRKVEGTMENGITVNGEPLIFYHFSGFDSGAQEGMLTKYGADSGALWQLREWYIAECEAHGQSALGKRPAKYDFYQSGRRITLEERLFFRDRPELMNTFKDPFDDTATNSYLAWYGKNRRQAEVMSVAKKVVKRLLGKR